MFYSEMRKASHRIVAFDGVDCCGKTTAANALHDRMQENGVPAKVISLLPEGPIRDILLHREEPLTPKQEAALFMVAAEDVKIQIQAALPTSWVILDRSPLSLMVYQGIFGGLKDTLPYLEHFFGKFPRIDYLYVLEIEYEAFKSRMVERSWGFDKIEERVLNDFFKYSDAYSEAAEIYRSKNSSARSVSIIPANIVDVLIDSVMNDIEQSESFA